LAPVTEDAVYVAAFDEEEILYTVTFINDDGAFLYEDKVAYNGKASYGGPAPKKASDHYHSYVFKGWDTPLSGIISDTTITALYEMQDIRYVVTFKNYDESVLYIDNVPYEGAAYNPQALPTRPSSKDCVYTFSGWDKPLSPITEDTVIHATYAESVPEYTVTFKNYDGTVLGTSTVKYSENATYTGATPTKPADEKYTYTFARWDRSLDNVTYDYFTIALFDSALKKFDVTFCNYDKSELQKVMVEYGNEALYSGATPTRPEDETYRYVFKEWNEKLDSITSDLTTYALFDAIPKETKNGDQSGSGSGGSGDGSGGKSDDDPRPAPLDLLQVFFDDWNGTYLDADDVPAGGVAYCDTGTPTRPADKKYTTYTFCSFDKSLVNVQKKFTTYAQYTVDDFLIPHYIVTFRNDDDSLLCEDVVEDGEMPSFLPGKAPVSATDPDALFIGWDRSLVIASKSYTLYAKYEPAFGGSSGGSDGKPGTVAGKPSTPDETATFAYQTTFQGAIHFREKSFANFSKDTWADPESYTSSVENATNPLYFMSDKLAAMSATSYPLTITYKETRRYPLTPNYTQTLLPATDTDAFLDPDLVESRDYAFTPFELTETNGAALTKVSFASENTTASEKEYASYAKKTYLSLSSEEKTYFDSVISTENLKAATPSDILNVVKYIQGAAKYNLNFGAYPSDCDFVLYFLKTAKEGTCGHFASALTLLLRDLGVPARFVSGYLSASKGKNILSNVTGKAAHAWCEAYFDGVGWISLDATPGSDDPGSMPGNTPSDTGDPSDDPGDTPSPGSDTPSKDPGDDSDSDSGDPYGSLVPGTTALIVFVATPDDDYRVYDGKATTFTGSYIGTLRAGEHVEYHFAEGKKDVGFHLPEFAPRIIDSTGKDVSKDYKGKVGFQYNTYTITPRPLTITTASARKKRDGTPLVAQTYTLEGTLAVDESPVLVFTGVQNDPGSSSNTVDLSQFAIHDLSGADVKNNYAITWVYGTLTID